VYSEAAAYCIDFIIRQIASANATEYPVVLIHICSFRIFADSAVLKFRAFERRKWLTLAQIAVGAFWTKAAHGGCTHSTGHIFLFFFGKFAGLDTC